MGQMRSFLVLMLLILPLYPFQAERDTIEASDTVMVSPLSGLRSINLLPSAEGRGPFYFQVDGDSASEKVSYFGSNLADYICNVKPARIKISQYRSLKTTQSGLLIGGCVLTAIGTFFTSQSGSVSPTMLIGLGTLSFSWIPGYVAVEKVPEAVDLYNRSLTRERELSSSLSIR